MEVLNAEFNGSLTLAIQIFKGTYDRPFLYQLVSGQLDMDRTDYLKRDSFYTGMAEGNINTDRIIAMLNVHNDQLVVEEKGIYTVEKFLVARRLMYWQVYLHKTSLVAEQLVSRALTRAQHLVEKGTELHASAALLFFLNHHFGDQINKKTLDQYALLDDYDIISALKSWCVHDDFVLRTLSNSIINRSLLKVKIRKKAFAKAKVTERITAYAHEQGITKEEAAYFVFTGQISNQGYNYTQGGIHILYRNGKCLDVIKASDQLSLKALTTVIVKNYMCYPKQEE